MLVTAITSRLMEPCSKRIEPPMCAVVLFGSRRVIGSVPLWSLGMMIILAPLETIRVQLGPIFAPRIHSMRMMMILVSIATTLPYFGMETWRIVLRVSVIIMVKTIDYLEPLWVPKNRLDRLLWCELTNLASDDSKDDKTPQAIPELAMDERSQGMWLFGFHVGVLLLRTALNNYRLKRLRYVSRCYCVHESRICLVRLQQIVSSKHICCCYTCWNC